MLIQGDMNPPCTGGAQRTRYCPHQRFACSWRCPQGALPETSEFIFHIGLQWKISWHFVRKWEPSSSQPTPQWESREWSLSAVQHMSFPARRQDPLSISHRSTTIKNSHSQRHRRNQILHTNTVSQYWLLATDIHVGMCHVRLWVLQRTYLLLGGTEPLFTILCSCFYSKTSQHYFVKWVVVASQRKYLIFCSVCI